jgi:ABC-type sugar transport system ATPase subunit
MTMADKIVVLNEGRVEQVGTPMELYHKPNSRFVAEFIGSPAMNVFSAHDGLRGLDLSPNAAFIGCRPEHFELVSTDEGHASAVVQVKEELGGESLLYLKVDGGDDVVARVDGDNDTQVGAQISLRIPQERLHQFDASGLTI